MSGAFATRRGAPALRFHLAKLEFVRGEKLDPAAGDRPRAFGQEAHSRRRAFVPLEGRAILVDLDEQPGMRCTSIRQQTYTSVPGSSARIPGSVRAINASNDSAWPACSSNRTTSANTGRRRG